MGLGEASAGGLTLATGDTLTMGSKWKSGYVFSRSYLAQARNPGDLALYLRASGSEIGLMPTRWPHHRHPESWS